MITPRRLNVGIGGVVIVAVAAATTAGCTGGHGPETAPRPTPTGIASRTWGSTKPRPAASATATASAAKDSDGQAPQPARPGKVGTPRGLTLKITTVQRTDADAVASAFGVLLGSSDTKIDNSVSDAARRAAVLATPGLAAQLRGQRSGPSPDWTELADHHGYTTVTVQLGGGGATPPDTATSGVRMITLSVQPHGDHGWQPERSDQTLLLFLHRNRPKTPWSISKFSYLS